MKDVLEMPVRKMTVGESFFSFRRARTALMVSSVLAVGSLFAAPFELDRSVMSDEYRRLWSDEVRASFDRDIEAARKGDGAFRVAAPVGTEITVEQTRHDFGFGAHSFQIGRLKTADINRRYERDFAALFNQVTIAFYWRSFETQPGNPHFHTGASDLESSFTSRERVKMDAHSRYFASPSRSTDQFLEFAKFHGMRIHGHPLVWSNVEWNHPYWLYDQFCPEEEKEFLRLPRKNPQEVTRLYAERDWIAAWNARMAEIFKTHSEEEIAARCPVYLATLKAQVEKHIAEIMDYCGARVDSWDVVNECANEYPMGDLASKPLVKCVRHKNLMPRDYVFEAYRIAAQHATPHARLSVNDNVIGDSYCKQIEDLLKRGARVDMIGLQFHIFKDEKFKEIVAGGSHRSISRPDDIRKTFARYGSFGLPVHLSEITIPAPGNTPEGLQQQAVFASDLYRAWFAQPCCAAITWWHTIDGANKDGGSENGYAGIFFLDGTQKPSYKALDDLINRQWHTSLRVKVAADGVVRFRGFYGTYRLTWRDASGREQTEIVRMPNPRFAKER